MPETTTTPKTPPSLDPVWEKDLYGKGKQINRYPYDFVVAFVYRNFNRGVPRHQTRIIEVGCGVGNNLWFAAREGFDVSGIDGSPSAIAYAQKRFADEGLKGDLRAGDYTQLPFSDNSFDIAIDRAALTCCGFSAAAKAISEVRRVLKTGGKFLFNPYSDRHASGASGVRGADGAVRDISAGTLVGVGQICFYSKDELLAPFRTGWQVQSLNHYELEVQTDTPPQIQAEWRLVVQKTGEQGR